MCFRFENGLSNIAGSSMQITISHSVQLVMLLWITTESQFLTRVVSKTKHSKTKTKARSTQISKTKHPKLENEAPKSGKRSTQSSKTKHPNLENEAPQTRKRSVLYNTRLTRSEKTANTNENWFSSCCSWNFVWILMRCLHFVVVEKYYYLLYAMWFFFMPFIYFNRLRRLTE